MGILDEAIREHLELKRQHGAADSELKQLEGEAFGPPERPGAEVHAGNALAEAPTEFMTAPEAAEENGSEATEASGAGEQTRQRREPSAIGDLQEAPAPPEPAEEEQPAAEHEAIAEPEPSEAPLDETPAPQPPPDAAPEESERQAIAEQPTELYDVGELAASAEPGPSDEELIEEEMDEPRLAPVDPLAGVERLDKAEVEEADADAATTASEPAGEEEEDDFFDEQRLSDELDQALDAPPKETEALDEDEAGEAAPPVEEGEHLGERDDDVLEHTPDFLEDTPEDDELWFEQKPPKDFDFDD